MVPPHRQGSRVAADHLHELRYGAASLALASGTDVKVVSGELGHDTYQTVFPEVARAAAEATAAMPKPARL